MVRTRDDFPRLGEHSWHPATGALRCWAVGAVVGVYDYPERGYRALVPAETLSDPASLDTLPGAVLTLRHAEADISPETYQSVAQGAVFAGHYDEREKGIVFPVAINGADALAAIKRGARHLSMGYHHSPPRAEPGEYEGQAYDVVQEERLYFEAALLDTDQTPRGGPRCRLLIGRTVDALPPTQPAETPGGSMDPAEKIKELEAKLAEMATRLQESESARAAQATAMEDMQKKMDAGEIAAAGPEIEAVAADMGVAKAADAAATLDALTAHLKMSAKGKDALPTIRVLAAAMARDAKPPAPKFNTPPEPVKTGDAKPTTDAAPAVQERM
jgi:hypothetical protein